MRTRKRIMLSLSVEACARLRGLSDGQGRPMSHIVEDAILRPDPPRKGTTQSPEQGREERKRKPFSLYG